jgi:hypothetical protein
MKFQGTNNHVGNELFRQMVNSKKCLYLHSSKRDKPSVSKGIVQAIRNLNPPGRFLQRDELTGMWYDIGDQKAREKTSQALREGAPEIRKSLNPGAGPGSVSGTDLQLSTSEAFSSHMHPAAPSSDGTWSNSNNRQLMPSSRPQTFSPNRAQDAAAFRRIPDIPSSLTPHLGASNADAQAIYQLLKAQQLQRPKTSTSEDVDRYALEQASAAAGAASIRALRHSMGNVGAQHPFSRAELEALVEARQAASLGSGQLQSHVNNTFKRVTNFADQIAAAAGISPSAASIALQLAARAGEYSALEEERERIRAASRRERDQEYYSQRRSRIASGVDYPPSASASASAPWQNSRPRMGGPDLNRSANFGLAGLRDSQATSNLIAPNEVQNRIAIAEQLAQLSCRLNHGAPKMSSSGNCEDVRNVTSDTPLPTISREDVGMPQNRSALFLDLGLMGVPLEDIQYALAKNFPLEELLHMAQYRLIGDRDSMLEKSSGVLESRRNVSDSYNSHVKIESQVKRERSDLSLLTTSLGREVKREPEANLSYERPTWQGTAGDSNILRDMVESALSSMGVELSAS